MPAKSANLMILLLVACLLILGGCGKKGPLYLPAPQQNQE